MDDLFLFSCCTCLAECNTAKGKDDLGHEMRIDTDLLVYSGVDRYMLCLRGRVYLQYSGESLKTSDSLGFALCLYSCTS